MNKNSYSHKVECKLNANSIQLKDVIDISVLQCFQDDFAKGVGMASITVDLDGNPITNPSNYTKFCMDYTHSTKCGDKRCVESHKRGGLEAGRTGKPVVYECHAGLIDFAAPIMLEGWHIGTILGGQVLTNPPHEAKYRRVAMEIGVDGDLYIQKVKDIRRLSKEQVVAAANVLYLVSNYMSKTAYCYQLLKDRSDLLSTSLNQISSSVHEWNDSSIVSAFQDDNKNQEMNDNSTIANQFNEIIDLTKNIERIIAVQQKEIARVDRLNLIGEMATGIGHEVRNPLTTVRGFLQHFARKEEFSSYDEIFSLMIEELDRANDIITEFLSLAKDRRIDFKKQDINQVITKLMPLLETESMLKSVQIKLNLGNVSLLLLDEKEIRQLILNLVRNAIEATKNKKAVKITTFMNDQKPVLQITDEGCGIPPDILEKIGTPFLSTKPMGTGLGVAVCYRIAERHSASMLIDSQEGIGTTVRVIFNPDST